METRIHEMMAATLRMLHQFSPLVPSLGSFSHLPISTLPAQPWDLHNMAAAEAAHIAGGERLRPIRLEQERYRRESVERAEAARLSSLYRTRQEELNRKLQELEAAEGGSCCLAALRCTPNRTPPASSLYWSSSCRIPTCSVRSYFTSFSPFGPCAINFFSWGLHGLILNRRQCRDRVSSTHKRCPHVELPRSEEASRE